MPARWPISDTDVSQLPRWPTASLTVSSADAAPAESEAATSAVAKRTFIEFLPATPLMPAKAGIQFFSFGSRSPLSRGRADFLFALQATRSRGASLPPPSVRQFTVFGTDRKSTRLNSSH